MMTETRKAKANWRTLVADSNHEVEGSQPTGDRQEGAMREGESVLHRFNQLDRHDSRLDEERQEPEEGNQGERLEDLVPRVHHEPAIKCQADRVLLRQ